jgi:hypothetical protein
VGARKLSPNPVLARGCRLAAPRQERRPPSKKDASFEGIPNETSEAFHSGTLTQGSSDPQRMRLLTPDYFSGHIVGGQDVRSDSRPSTQGRKLTSPYCVLLPRPARRATAASSARAHARTHTGHRRVRASRAIVDRNNDSRQLPTQSRRYTAPLHQSSVWCVTSVTNQCSRV